MFREYHPDKRVFRDLRIGSLCLIVSGVLLWFSGSPTPVPNYQANVGPGHALVQGKHHRKHKGRQHGVRGSESVPEGQAVLIVDTSPSPASVKGGQPVDHQHHQAPSPSPTPSPPSPSSPPPSEPSAPTSTPSSPPVAEAGKSEVHTPTIEVPLPPPANPVVETVNGVLTKATGTVEQVTNVVPDVLGP